MVISLHGTNVARLANGQRRRYNNPHFCQTGHGHIWHCRLEVFILKIIIFFNFCQSLFSIWSLQGDFKRNVFDYHNRMKRIGALHPLLFVEQIRSSLEGNQEWTQILSEKYI